MDAVQGAEGAEWKEMRHGGGLGGVGVSESYVSGVRTPANLPHFVSKLRDKLHPDHARTDIEPRWMGLVVRTARYEQMR